jgi:hypothetical protein
MRKKKTKKKRFETFFDFIRHLPAPFGHLTGVHLRAAFAYVGLLAGLGISAMPSACAEDSGKPHTRVYLIFVDVFDDQGFALPGARVRVRRSTEKKFRWEGTSDHQGEVAFRVPPGESYEVTVEARGFKMQTRNVDTRQENRADLTFRMEPQTEKHTGPEAGGKP